jgi:hypothetical protein
MERDVETHILNEARLLSFRLRSSEGPRKRGDRELPIIEKPDVERRESARSTEHRRKRQRRGHGKFDCAMDCSGKSARSRAQHGQAREPENT